VTDKTLEGNGPDPAMAVVPQASMQVEIQMRDGRVSMLAVPEDIDARECMEVLDLIIQAMHQALDKQTKRPRIHLPGGHH